MIRINLKLYIDVLFYTLLEVVKMVVPSGKRTSKFTNKFDADVARARFAAVKGDATTNYSDVAGTWEARENAVNNILNNAGILAPLRPSYLNVGRESLGIKNRYNGVNATSNTEAALAGKKWIGRGLVTTFVNSILALDGFTAIS
jgi:hypothetical protein